MGTRLGKGSSYSATTNKVHTSINVGNCELVNSIVIKSKIYSVWFFFSQMYENLHQQKFPTTWYAMYPFEAENRNILNVEHYKNVCYCDIALNE